jgi:dimethylargininase
VPDSFERALTRDGRPDLDVGAARAQHDVYRGHLANAGYEVEVVSSDENHPDCVFIEDTAVVLGSVAVITRPGAPSRRGETGPVAQALSDRFPIVEIAEPGTIDGGDVFVAEGTVYVGRSSRTNQEAIDQLRAIALGQGMELVVVDVLDTLHLKSAVLPIDTHTVVVTPSAVDEAPLRHLRILYEAATERHRFSALPLHDDTVLVTANAPATAEMVTDLGRNVIPIDVSQIQAADGGLTCMSILF